ncbi:MAG TPA: hypothetical protein PLL90_05130 [Bacteroidales bacterium]|nr:hypothetical protein [Bacteroidales bacterium]
MNPRNKLSDFFIILLLIWLPSGVFAQKTEAAASLDSNNILIGDQVKLTYKFSFPSTATPLMPVIADTLTKEVEVVSRSKMDTTVSADKKFTTFTQSLYISSFDSGTFVIPPMVFAYRMPNDTANYFASTNPIMLYVNTVHVDTTKEFKDIKMPLGEPLTWREVLPWVLLGLAILLISGIIIYVLRKLRKKEPIIQLPQKPKIPPYEKALTELEDLRIQKLWQSGKTKEFHSGLTDILRIYLEGQFQVEAMEMVTADLIASLKTAHLPEEEIKRLEKILTLADMVKFAKFNPLPDEHDHSLKNGVLFVENTRPKTSVTTQAGTTNEPNKQKPEEEPKTE